MGVWTDRSRAIIRRTLESLPVSATERECKQALHDAYEFGPRENHPYNVWCRECREALAKRFAGRVAQSSTPTVHYTLSVRGLRLWLDVSCGFCQRTTLLSCLACTRRRVTISQVADHPDFPHLAALPCEEEAPTQYLVLADLVEEVLGERPVYTPKPRRKKKAP